jgi:flagellar motility protein MotE (MotC chaperone)
MRMNEVFETIAEVFEELRSEAGESEYSVQTKESEKADKELKKVNREYEKLLTEVSAEHKQFLEDYMDIVNHAHFQEEQRAYYQGMVDVMQIFDGLGILKERNKVKEVLMHIKK